MVHMKVKKYISPSIAPPLNHVPIGSILIEDTGSVTLYQVVGDNHGDALLVQLGHDAFPQAVVNKSYHCPGSGCCDLTGYQRRLYDNGSQRLRILSGTLDITVHEKEA